MNHIYEMPYLALPQCIQLLGVNKLATEAVIDLSEVDLCSGARAEAHGLYHERVVCQA